MDFKAWKGKIFPARVAEKVSNFWPKTWILRRETEKLGPRDWRKKCLIFDQKQEFKAWNGKIRSARVAEKVSNFWPSLIFDQNMDFKAWKGKIFPARVAEKVSNFWPKTWILRREKEKSFPREWRKKCRIFDQKHGF